MPGRARSLLLSCLLLALGSATGLAVQSPIQGRKFALLVGVNEYQHPKLQRLKYAENDVTELRDLLRQAGYSVTLLCDSEGKRDDSKAPTKANIEKHLTRLLKDQCRNGDTVIIAFAGHGLQFKGQKDAFFCPADARPSEKKTDTLISLTKVYEELDDSFAGVKVLLVDACREDPKASRGLDGDNSPTPPRGVAAFFSCKPGEVAYEHEKYRHGVFFHFVLEGLRGKAKNSKGLVTFGSLVEYVQGEVSSEVPTLIKEGARQSPHLKADLSGPSPVLIAKTKDYCNPGDVTTNMLGMKFAWIPPGTFTMGSRPGEKDRQENEVQHKVTLTRGFYMAVYPVTQKQWQAVMGDNPSYFKKGDDYPVEKVSWEDCQKFVKKLSEREGQEYRLPTEAEWEYACRAGTRTAYYTGDGVEALNRAGWYSKNSGEHTHPVGRKEANKWGLHDMHGNVSQWCEDLYHDNSPNDGGISMDLKYRDGGEYHVLRGGSWDDKAHICRAAFRDCNTSGYRDAGTGVRVVFVSSPRTP